MITLLDKIFETKAKKSEKIFRDTKSIVGKQNEIAEQKKELDDLEYSIILEKKNEFFISLADFIDLMDMDDFSMNVILKKCKHSSELAATTSIVEVSALIEDEHIVLCLNPKKCELHKSKSMQKLRIATVRGAR